MLKFFQYLPYNFQILTQQKNATKNNNCFGKIEQQVDVTTKFHNVKQNFHDN